MQLPTQSVCIEFDIPPSEEVKKLAVLPEFAPVDFNPAPRRFNHLNYL